ncbi:hypothetical protein BaRGS_00035431 [Batillaria attramentaria]|uniref:C1q domain-containing protein n=1 Tax=Batillaria attramentaria TaxID=370345 RepID=A0ABD0JEB4_9CAEN
MSHLPSLLLLLLVVNTDSVRGTEPKSREQLTIELEKLSQKVEQLEAREGDVEKLGEKLGEALGEKLGDKLQEGITKSGEKQTEGIDNLGQELGEKLTKGLDKLGETIAASQTCGTSEEETTPTTTKEPQRLPATCPPCDRGNAALSYIELRDSKTLCPWQKRCTTQGVGFFVWLSNPSYLTPGANVFAGGRGKAVVNAGGGFNVTTGVFTAPFTGKYKFFGTALAGINFIASAEYIKIVGKSGRMLNGASWSSGRIVVHASPERLSAGDTVWATTEGTGHLQTYVTAFGGLLLERSD